METAVTTSTRTLAIPAIEQRCAQCGEKLGSQRLAVALPTPRTSVEPGAQGTQLCTDCGVHDLPHTD